MKRNCFTSALFCEIKFHFWHQSCHKQAFRCPINVLEKKKKLLTFSIILGYSLLPSGNKIHQAAIPLFCSKFVQSELYCSLLCTTRSLEWPAAFSPLPEESGVLSWLKSQKEWGHDVENPACYWSQQTVTNNTPMNAHGNLYVTDMYEGHFIHVFLYRQGGVMIVLLCYKGFTQGRHFLRNGFVFIQALQWSVWPWHLLRTKKYAAILAGYIIAVLQIRQSGRLGKALGWAFMHSLKSMSATTHGWLFELYWRQSYTKGSDSSVICRLDLLV